MKRIFLIIILLQVAPCTAAEQNTRYLGSNGFYSSYPQQPQGPLLLLNQQIMNPGYINRFPQIAPQQVNYSVQPNLLPQVTPQQFTYPMQADWLQQAPQQQLIYPEYPPYPAQIDFMPTMATMPLPPAALTLLEHHNSSSLPAESSTQIPTQLSLSTDETQQLTYPGYPPYPAQVDFIQSMPDIPVAPAALALPQYHKNSSRRTKSSTQIPAQLSKRTNRVQKKTRITRPRYLIKDCAKQWLKDNKITEDNLSEINRKELKKLLSGQEKEVITAVKEARGRASMRKYRLTYLMNKQKNELTNQPQQLIHPKYSNPAQTAFMSSMPAMPVAPATRPPLRHHNSSSLHAESSTQIPTPLSVSTDDPKKTRRIYLRYAIEECAKQWLEDKGIAEKDLPDIDITYLNTLLERQTKEVITAIKKARKRGYIRRANLIRSTQKGKNTSIDHDPEHTPYPAQTAFMPSMSAIPVTPAALPLFQHNHRFSLPAESSTQIPAQLSLSTNGFQQLTYPGYSSFPAQTAFMSSMLAMPVAPATRPPLRHHNSSSLYAESSTQMATPLSKAAFEQIP